MNPEARDIVMALVGTGGLGVIIANIGKLILDWRAGRLSHEDDVLRRYQELAENAAAERDRERRIAAWYRAHYAQLWRAYARLPDTDATDFPPGPPPDLH